MKITRAILILFNLLLVSSVVFSQASAGKDTKIIVILGSSVAAGWVTSYKEKYDMQNGYAARLSRFLEPKGWEVINISIPGYNTKETINRFEKDVLPLKPDYVFIGLSLGNEGLETENPDSVLTGYTNGIQALISLCRQNNFSPVIGLCYSNNGYTTDQYGYLKRMNMLINSWNVPCVNLLGVLDDGNGHFPERFIFDPGHPDDRGHEEFFYAFVPDLFDALEKGKTLSVAAENTKSITLGEFSEFHKISYIPAEVMHSFSFGFSYSTSGQGLLAEIRLPGADLKIMLNNTGSLVYQSQGKSIVSNQKPEKKQFHKVMLTHGYLTQKTVLYLDDKKAGEVMEQLEPVRFLIGNNTGKVGYKDLYIFRGALNQNEVAALSEGKKIQASLEVFSTLADPSLSPGMKLNNLAISLGSAQLDSKDDDQLSSILKKKIDQAEIVRKNELKVEHKKAIALDPKIYDLYIGQYEVAPDDFFVIEKKNDQLYFVDRGNSAELLPETINKFFINYPADLTVLFELDGEGNVSGLVFSLNGKEMEAKKIK